MVAHVIVQSGFASGGSWCFERGGARRVNTVVQGEASKVIMSAQLGTMMIVQVVPSR